jgi:glucuronokinase
MPLRCIVLVAGTSPELEGALGGTPKALLPVGGSCALDRWWGAIQAAGAAFSEILVVTNADAYKHVERWATAAGFPRKVRWH